MTSISTSVVRGNDLPDSYGNRVEAFASVVIDQKILIRNMRVILNGRGHRLLANPSVKGRMGKYTDVVFFLGPFADEVKLAVFGAVDRGEWTDRIRPDAS